MPTPAQPLTVTELTRRIKSLLEDTFPTVWVAGEISNFRSPGSGHLYFTLKDANAQLAAVVFRNVATRTTFPLRDGLAVIAHGELSVYERHGQYQLVVRQLLPKGLGALQLAFEELKRRLAAEGLFAADRKKPIPALPLRIGVITSPTGAAVRDFLHVIHRRFPNLHIVIYPVRVQGAGAAQEVAAAIDHVNALHAQRVLPLDVLVVTRGGGSLEDLWAFNEEIVARALARSQIPTISAVGHEIDFTISDFVADLRAPTPSAAAELVVKVREEFERQLADHHRRLTKDLKLHLATARERFHRLAASYVFRQPAEIIRQSQQRVDDLDHRLRLATRQSGDDARTRLTTAQGKFRLLHPQVWLGHTRQRVETAHRRFDSASVLVRERVRVRLAVARDKLELLSPNSTLARGYSITRTPAGRLVRSIRQVKPGQPLTTKVLDGEFGSVVT